MASGLSGDDLPWPARHLSLQSCHCRKSGHLIGSTLASWPPNNDTIESLATCLAECYNRLATNMDLTLSLAGRGRYGRHIVQTFGDNKGCSTLFILHRRGYSLVEQYILVLVYPLHPILNIQITNKKSYLQNSCRNVTIVILTILHMKNHSTSQSWWKINQIKKPACYAGCRRRPFPMQLQQWAKSTHSANC